MDRTYNTIILEEILEDHVLGALQKTAFRSC